MGAHGKREGVLTDGEKAEADHNVLPSFLPVKDAYEVEVDLEDQSFQQDQNPSFPVAVEEEEDRMISFVLLDPCLEIVLEVPDSLEVEQIVADDVE